MKHLIKIGSKGDTIIEILLSIAVLSMVLSVSYGLANRSSQTTRQAQERGEAQKLAEEQLELLRGVVSLDNAWEDQCFNTSGDPTSTAAECNGRGPGGLYDVSVSSTGENTFIAEVSWDNIRGALDRDTLSLAYKLPVTGDIPETPHYECNDGLDNDGPGVGLDDWADAADPDCHTDHNRNNLGSYDLTIDEEDPPPPVRLTVIKTPSAGGLVTGSGINCGSTCVKNSIPSGTLINLSANPAANYTFSGWNPSNCNSFSITANTTCRAIFTYIPPQCSDSNDNDGDFRTDSQDPGCHTDGDRFNSSTYDPNYNDESRCSFAYKSLCF